MCECKILMESDLVDPVLIDTGDHDFVYIDNEGKQKILLKDIALSGIINYASVSEIKNAYGVKAGYMFIVGES